MELQAEKIGDKVMVYLAGDLDTAEKADQLNQTMKRLTVEDGEKNVILNLDDTININSYGIGKILMYYKRLKGDGGGLYITSPTEPVKELFETLMLDSVLKIYAG